MPNKSQLIQLGDNWIRADAILAVSSVFAGADNGQWKFLVLLKGGHEISDYSDDGEGAEEIRKNTEKKRNMLISDWRRKC